MSTFINKYSNCFLNATLQLITSSEDIMKSFTCPEMVNFFDLYRKGGIIDIIEIMKYYQQLNKSIIYGHHHDAVDTLVYLLDQCSDKSQFLIRIDQTVINKKFTGIEDVNITREIIKSGVCEIEVSSKTTEETILSIPIKDNILDSILEYFKEVDEDIYEIEKEIEELVDVDNNLMIQKIIKRKVKIIRSSPKINYNPGNSPNYLFLSLKRFDYELNKDNTYVNILNGITYNSIHYNIIGFVIHIGGTQGGHYVTIKMILGIWYLYDDTVRTQISDKDALNFQLIGYIYILVKDELYFKNFIKENIDEYNISITDVNGTIMNIKYNVENNGLIFSEINSSIEEEEEEDTNKKEMWVEIEKDKLKKILGEKEYDKYMKNLDENI